MRQHKVTRVTISLPNEILSLADRLARERSTTRSGIIAQVLENEEKSRVEALMEEGYRAMAEENAALANDAFTFVREGIERGTKWDDGT